MRLLLLLTVLLAAAAAPLAAGPTRVLDAAPVPGAADTLEVTQPLEAPLASSILGLASQAIGTYQGECFPWVRRIVSQATGQTMGFGYRDGYLAAGAIEVPLADARGGDIIQLIDDADDGPNADYAGMHTSIVADVLGGGLFRVIDSNLGFDGIVRVREDYNPMALAARFSRISVHVYRFGAAGTSTPPPATNQLIGLTPPGGTATAPQQSATGTAVIRADGDCLRLRAAPSTSAPVRTCLPDGGTVTLLDGTQQADGVTWQAVSAGGLSGWVAAQYLVRSSSTAAPPASTPPPSAPVSTAPPPAAAPAPASANASIIGEVPANGGLALIVFSGGPVDGLLSVINARGCAPTSVWTTPAGGGGLIGMIVGAPAAVNRDWSAQFPGGNLGQNTPLLLVCRGGPPPQLVAAPPTAAAPPPVGGTANRGAGPPGPAGN